jgi:hypothetical protein
MLRNVRCLDAKVCADCRYFRPQFSHYYANDRLKYGVCTHPNVTNIDIITGDHTYPLAETVRRNKDLCGSHGKYFYQEDKVLLILRMIRIHIRFNIILSNIAHLAFFICCCSIILLACVVKPN